MDARSHENKLAKHNKIEIIADFLCNSLEHYSTDEAAKHIFEEVGVSVETARILVVEYLAKYSAVPVVPNSELFPFIDSIICSRR